MSTPVVGVVLWLTAGGLVGVLCWMLITAVTKPVRGKRSK